MVVLSLTRKQAPAVSTATISRCSSFSCVGWQRGREAPQEQALSHSRMWQGTYYHENPGLRQSPAYSRTLEELEGAGAEKVCRETMKDQAAETISSGVLWK